MGSFLGHAIPGTFFGLFAVWWATQIPRRRLMCEQKKIPYFNTATFPVPLKKLSQLPVEGIVKMLACIIGMSCELFASMDYGHAGYIKSKSDMQHFTMYSFFLVTGLVDCFVYKGWKLFPQGMDYITLVLAFVGEWILFRYHLAGHQQLDVDVHGLLLYAIVACAMFTALEFKFQDNELLVFLRSYSTLLQATWFYQIGFIMYPPSPNVKQWEDTFSDRLLASMVFAWHMICDLLVVTAIYLFASCTYKRHCRLFDFHVEHQMTSGGWSLRKLRQKLSRKTEYSRIPTEEDQVTLLSDGEQGHYNQTNIELNQVQNSEL